MNSKVVPIIALLLGLILIAVITASVLLILDSASRVQNTPCSYYSNFPERDVPARCIKEFTK